MQPTGARGRSSDSDGHACRTPCRFRSGAGLRAPRVGSHARRADLERALAGLVRVPLGATAVGTGIGAPHGFREVAVRHLAERRPGVEATGDLFDGLQHLDAYVAVASELGRACLVASKLAADLRLLSSGPHGGLGEAVLPAVQAGSTIMPGKVNPVIPELVLQVGFEVEGARRVVEHAAGAGELELNVMEPAIAASLLPALEKAGRTRRRVRRAMHRRADLGRGARAREPRRLARHPCPRRADLRLRGRRTVGEAARWTARLSRERRERR